jgi:glycosyltransferase involved in cell wall biosynthesis
MRGKRNVRSRRRKRRTRIGAARRTRFTRIRNSANPKVSVIIPVVNERKTIARVIRNAARVHPETEVIVVANGSTDGTKQLAERMGAKVIHYHEPLGHDVGRSVGASAAKGDILLFTDGDLVIPTSELRPFVQAVEGGVDVALNRYAGPTDKPRVHNVVLAKYALNAALHRSDLRGASMTAVPHAISRNALNRIGAEHLAVPPKAHAIAIVGGLNVQPVHYVDVGRINPKRRRNQGVDPLERLIVGDHLEALHWFALATDPRGRHTDLSRLREIVR